MNYYQYDYTILRVQNQTKVLIERKQLLTAYIPTPKGRGFTPPLITPHCWEGLNMFKINTMMEPNVCLLLFAAAVTLFLLPGALMDRTRGRAFMKCFIALLLAAIFMLLGEAGLW